MHADVIGNLTHAPEHSVTSSGTPVARLRVASSDRYRDAEGVWTSAAPVFVGVDVWGDAAAEVKDWPKGARVVVVGRWVAHEWTDKESGEARRTQRIKADAVGLAAGARKKATPREAEDAPPPEIAAELWDAAQ